MSFSNNFVVSFEGPAAAYFNSEEVEFFCDEAQLPNVNTATGTQNGLYVGLGSVDYPHTRVFTEFQLSFMLDANLNLLKSLNSWYGSIFNENGTETYLENRSTRLAYKDSYASTINITKTESGPDSTTQRKPITYVMEKAYPYAVDAIPLQFGSSQLTKVTAQFKYQRHYTINRDITAVTGKPLVQEFKTITGRSILAEAQRQTSFLDLRGAFNDIS
tara:strand:+ start:392 stop:1042 length:651 start_codon:yes stop_codon:yes gene_type:complete